jgi:hypothetical protein
MSPTCAARRSAITEVAPWARWNRFCAGDAAATFAASGVAVGDALHPDLDAPLRQHHGDALAAVHQGRLADVVQGQDLAGLEIAARDHPGDLLVLGGIHAGRGRLLLARHLDVLWSERRTGLQALGDAQHLGKTDDPVLHRQDAVLAAVDDHVDVDDRRADRGLAVANVGAQLARLAAGGRLQMADARLQFDLAVGGALVHQQRLQRGFGGVGDLLRRDLAGHRLHGRFERALPGETSDLLAGGGEHLQQVVAADRPRVAADRRLAEHDLADLGRLLARRQHVGDLADAHVAAAGQHVGFHHQLVRRWVLLRFFAAAGEAEAEHQDGLHVGSPSWPCVSARCWSRSTASGHWPGWRGCSPRRRAARRSG